MKVIDFESIKGLNINCEECYKWTEETIKNKNLYQLPPKISISPKISEDVSGVFCNVMPSIIYLSNGEKYGGIKVVTRYPNRVPSLDSKVLLFNAENGEYLALIDGDFITTMRTGAVACHSILTFAKKNFSNIAIMGLGNTARATLLILLSQYNRKLHCKILKYKGQEKDFMNRFSCYKNITFEVVDNVEQLAKGTDVFISAVTYCGKDVCSPDVFEKGTLLVPIHTRGFTACDLVFDKIFADDTGHVCHFGNFDKFKKFAEVSDVLNGKVCGRENDDERIIAYNVGVSIHDVRFASEIYKRFIQKNPSVKDLTLNQPNEKFWI